MPDYVIFLFELSDSLGVICLDCADALFEKRLLGPDDLQVLSFVFFIGAEHELVWIDGSDRRRGQARRLGITLCFHVASILFHVDLQQSGT